MAAVLTDRYVTHDAGGGGIGTEGDPWTIVEGMANAAAGDRLNVKAGTYTLAASLSPTNSGTRSNPIEARGYASTIDDSDSPDDSGVIFDRNGTDGRVITCTKSWWTWKYLAFTGNAARSQHGVYLGTGGDENVFYRCRAYDIGRSAFYADGLANKFIGCEASGFGTTTAGNGFLLSGQRCWAIGCYGHDSGGASSSGFSCNDNRAGGFLYCIGYNNHAYGFTVTPSPEKYPAMMIHCIADGNASHGLYLGHGTSNASIDVFNSLFTNNGGHGISAHATGTGRVVMCGAAFYNNSSGEVDTDVEELELVPRISLTDDPYVKASGDDFRLNRTARSLLGAGFPQYFLNDGALTPWVGFPDITAVCSGRGIGDVGAHGNHWTDTRRTWDGG